MTEIYHTEAATVVKTAEEFVIVLKDCIFGPYPRESFDRVMDELSRGKTPKKKAKGGGKS